METLFIILASMIASFAIFLLLSKKKPESAKRRTDSSAKEDEIPEDDLEKLYESWTDNYNFRRAMELLGAREDQQALEYLNKALEEDEDNACAHEWVGHIFLHHQEYGTALKAFNAAIQNTPASKLSPILVARSRVYHSLGNEDARLADLEKAVENDPKESSVLQELAEYHYEHGDFGDSDIAIDRYIELEPHDTYGFMVKGRNEFMRKHYNEAIELYEYASKLDGSYIAAWSFKAEALLKLGRTSEAIDCEIKALGMVESKRELDNKTLEMRSVLALEACDLFCLKLKGMVAKGENASDWMASIGLVYSIASRYVEAAAWYHNSHEQDPDHSFLSFEAYCWQKAGNYGAAVGLLQQALIEDPDNYKYKQQLSLALAEQGDLEQAFDVCDELVKIQPDEPSNYYNRARIEQLLGQNDKAIEDYSIVLDLKDGNDAAAHLFRGLAYGDNGEENLSREEYLSIISIREMEGRELHLPMAYALMGNHEKATTAMELLENSLPSSRESDYRIRALIAEAATFSQIGDMERAFDKMKDALEQGARRFDAYRRTRELSELRKDPRFEIMLQQYEQKIMNSWKEVQTESKVFLQRGKDEEPGLTASLIPFRKENGVCKVPCKVNDLPLHFIFDTGASEVTMSTVEATFMLKNGYLKKQDLYGSEYYSTASGEIAEGTKIRLREVDFGGVKLTNVKASVVKSQNAPLLLGQSVLQRLGKIEIDNDRKVILINGPVSTLFKI